mmetsp:Transcript_58147/g.177185  ORF Transcript_58147/g.177185 Transcript_58147/m.177185 type:complete len:246 (+) Transcript_58147:852-1589(+)
MSSATVSSSMPTNDNGGADLDVSLRGGFALSHASSLSLQSLTPPMALRMLATSPSFERNMGRPWPWQRTGTPEGLNSTRVRISSLAYRAEASSWVRKGSTLKPWRRLHEATDHQWSGCRSGSGAGAPLGPLGAPPQRIPKCTSPLTLASATSVASAALVAATGEEQARGPALATQEVRLRKPHFSPCGGHEVLRKRSRFWPTAEAAVADAATDRVETDLAALIAAIMWKIPRQGAAVGRARRREA